MQSTIFKSYELNKIDQCSDKYIPLINAIKDNYNMDMLGLYKSNISEGLFIHSKLKISIPTNGVYEELDVRSNEEVIIFARPDYPFSAPAVLFVRNDFPTNRIPHLNHGVSNSNIHLLNPCLYRGNIDEWFYQNGPIAFCERVNNWFSDLVNGELMNDNGFETVRYENTDMFVEIDSDNLFNIISTYGRDYGAQILSMKQKTKKYFKILNQEYSKGLDENILPCIFVFDRRNIVSDYISLPFYTEKDLKIFPCERRINHGLRKIERTYYESKKIDTLDKVLIVLAVKRPMQVIGGFSNYEFITVLLSYNFKSPITLEKCSVQKVIPIQALNNTIAERLSGTTQVLKKPIIMLGCGAIGSKISMSLARMGYTEQHFYDEDIILPHNLIRHYESSNSAVGIPKAMLMKLEIDSMFTNNSTYHNENIFHTKELVDGLTIDCTASKRSLFWAISSEKIKLPMLRTEIYLGGKIGLSLLEGKNRNPDVYDIQVSLYGMALKDEIISQWLTYTQPEDMRYHIGFGCSSDTMILDDATISNHASIVPHLINKFQDKENGIACVNYFDIDNLTNNRLHIYEMEPMIILPEVDGWSIHIRSSLYQKIYEYSKEEFENAGLWIGNIEEHTKRITVVDTYIPEDNDRKKATVTMGKAGVKPYLNTLVTKTNGLLTYIGEWHTHTSGNAFASQTDKKTFDKTRPNTVVFLMTIVSPTNTQNYIIKGKKQ